MDKEREYYCAYYWRFRFFSTIPIRDSLVERVDQVLGYDNISESLNDLIVARADSLYDWKIEKNWIVYMPSIVLGLNLCCRIFLDKNQKAISELPVYPPIFNAVTNANRCLKTTRLLCL